MSVNPLFTGVAANNQSPFYNNANTSSRPLGQRTGNLPQQTNVANYRGSPVPRKKPRIADVNSHEQSGDSDPFQGCDSLTEDDLEAVDMITSQALSQQPQTNFPQTHGHNRPESAPTFRHQPSSIRNPNPTVENSRFTFKQTASRSSNSNPFPKAQPNQHTPFSGSQIYNPSATLKGSASPRAYHAGSSEPNKGPHYARNLAFPSKGNVQSGVSPKTARSDTDHRKIPPPYSTKVGANPWDANTGRVFHSSSGGNSTASLTPPKEATEKEFPSLPLSEKYTGPSPTPTIQQQQKNKADLEAMKLELKRLTNDHLTKDGEIKVLRQNLTKIKSDMSRQQMDKLQADEQRKMAVSTMEREHKKEVESLRTQLQFKEMELMQATSASQRHHAKPLPLQPFINAPSTPQKHHSKPLPLQPSNNAPSTPQKHPTAAADDSDVFPTQQSFMSGNSKESKGLLKSPRLRTLSENVNHHRSSPKGSPRRSVDAIKSSSKVSPARPPSLSSLGSSFSPSTSRIKPPRVTRPACLCSAYFHKVSQTDAELVADLLHDLDAGDYYGLSSLSLGGLIGLVQAVTTQDRVANEATDTCETTKTWLSTSKSTSSKTLSTRTLSVKATSPVRCLPSTNPNLELAARAVSNLLKPPHIPLLPPKSHPSQLCEPEFLPDAAGHVVNLLPLLDDQLSTYVDVTQGIIQSTSAHCSTCPSSGSAASRSADSSLDPLSGSSSRDWSVLLCHAEVGVQTSLALLRKLLGGSTAVCEAVLSGSSASNPEPLETNGDTSMMEIDPSAPLIDPTQACSKLNGNPQPTSDIAAVPPGDAPSVGHHGNRILSKLMRLASMQHGLGNCSSVVESALDTLKGLVLRCSCTELERLQSLLVHDALYNAMSSDSNLRRTCHALNIISALSLSWKVASNLCNHSDTCLLLQCYRCGVHGPSSCKYEEKLQLTTKVISVLWRLISRHHHGLTTLLDTDCQCSVELSNAVILMIKRLVVEAAAVSGTPNKNWRNNLREGLLVLHSVATHDRSSTDKLYVHTVVSFIRMYRRMPDITDNETCSLQDLWELNQWDETEWEAEEEEGEELDEAAPGMEVDQ